MAELRYSNRDYAAIRAAMVADAQNKTPEWTNFNQGELGVALIELVSSALDILSYSLDGLSNETFLPTAITKPAVVALLRNIGYEMRRRVASTAGVRFVLNTPSPTPITIPAGTIVGNDAGIEFVVREDSIIQAGALSALLTVYEGIYHLEGPFTASGQDDQFLQFGYNDVSNNFLDVFIDGILWTEEKFATLQPTQDPNIYRVTEHVDSTSEVLFSTALGGIPAAGSLIEFRYASTNGATGNIGANVIDSILTEVEVPIGISMSVVQGEQSGGGRERETIRDAKVDGPRSLRTLERVVTLLDYIDFVDMQNGVESASAINHTGFVEMYVRLAADEFGDYPVFKVEAPIVATPVDDGVGGTIPANTELFIAVTSKDANGRETNYTRVQPSTGVSLGNPVSITTSGGPDTHSIEVRIAAPQPLNTASFNIYIGTSEAAMYLAANDVSPTDIVDGVGFTLLTSIPVGGTIAPVENLAGEQNPLTSRSHYQDIYDAVEPRKAVVSEFDLFEPTAFTIDVTLQVAVMDNYRRDEVSTAVGTYASAFFVSKALGDDFYASQLEAYLFANVAGIRNVSVTSPGDQGISETTYMVEGITTINVSGGIS